MKLYQGTIDMTLYSKKLIYYYTEKLKTQLLKRKSR